ncbi:MAG: helix-turn-helix domain-containing protein [bacterium]|nr:helix-turn-helix domain-containing protein [bacterium]
MKNTKLIKDVPSLCSPDCPVKKTADIIDGKWVTLIVRDLLSGKKRYSELLKSLVGVSPKILAARLKYLEEKGILTRKPYPTVPPKTEYELTKLGLKLKDVVLAMEVFGEHLS